MSVKKSCKVISMKRKRCGIGEAREGHDCAARPSDLWYEPQGPGQATDLNPVRERGVLGEVVMDLGPHPPDSVLERYHLGMVTDDAELSDLEAHLVACPSCVDRAEESANYVDAMRRAMLTAGFGVKYHN